MRIVCLSETLLNPQRFILAVWDSDIGRYIEGAEWVVHATGESRTINDRMRISFNYFVSGGCGGVTTEVCRMFERCGITLPNSWRVYDTRK
jgi:hypothetical protein